MIRSLKLQGWKSHELTEFEFTRGTNVLVGIMGSGKSSVLQAITFALYGEVPEVRSRKLALSDMLMRKPRRLERAVVELEFAVDDVIYKVERSLTRDGSEARLFREGSLLEVGSRKVTRKVTELLGTDYESFVNVVYARQNEIDNFLRFGKTDRVKLIDGLLKIDRLEDARKKLRSFHTGVGRSLEELKKKAAADVSGVKERLGEVERKIRELEGELSDLQRVVGSTREKFLERQQLFEEMDRLRVEREKLASRVSRLKGEKKALESRISRLPKLKDAPKKLESARKKLERLRSREKELISRLSSLNAKKEQLSKRLEELERYRDKAGLKVRDYSRELEKKREELASLKGELDVHLHAIEQLKSAGAKCPVCGSPLKDPEKHIKRHEGDVASLNRKVARYGKELEELEMKQRESERLRVEVEKAKSFVGDIPRLREELAGLDSRPLEEELDGVRGELTGLEKEVEKLEKAVERGEMESQLKTLEGELKSSEARLEGLGFDEKAYRELRDGVSELRASLSSMKSRMQSIPQTIEARQSEASALRRQLEEVRNAKEQAKRTEKALESLSILINAIADVQILVRRRFVELVNELLGDIWCQLYPYGDYSSLRIDVETDGRRTGDYVLQLLEKRGWVNVDGVASGGERSIASLALRVAFAKALSRLGLLLLDEPTHNLDDSGVERLADVLREGMPSVLEQVLIITHEERMEKASTGSVYKLLRDKAAEGPTQVERL